MENVNVISSRSWWRETIRLIRSLKNIRVVFNDGATGQALYSDNDVVIQIPGPGAGPNPDFGRHPFQITQNAWLYISVAPGWLTVRSYPPVCVASGVQSQIFIADKFNVPIAVPDNESFIVVYIDISDFHVTPQVKIATLATADPNWTSFGESDDNHFVLGVVDTLTHHATRTMVIDQYISASCVHLIGIEMGSTISGPHLTVFHGTYVVGTPYAPVQSMAVGTIGQGFPSDGLYLFTASGFGVGPGNNWQQLSTL